MGDVAVRVENLSKVFRIYDRASDRLREAFTFGRRRYSTEFAALKNVSFEIEKGDFVGIVGRNGAGKSTLLRILSRELTPTAGQVTINGIVSLLQLGVGFDGELTGIENARFASKILGYSNAEIDRMLKDIIEFADLGEFIRHPVKTYSSGMYSRLSFAVGVNINPDILIADEVLAVGDMRFSQKCLRKMHEFKASGKTVILVTHDTGSVGVFCNKAIWLKDGEIFEQGEAKAVSEDFKNYMLYDRLPSKSASRTAQLAKKFNNASTSETQTPSQEAMAGSSRPLKENFEAGKTGNTTFRHIAWVNVEESPQISDPRARILRAAMLDAETLTARGVFHPHDKMLICFEVEALEDLEKPYFGYLAYDRNGLIAMHSNSELCTSTVQSLTKGEKRVASFRLELPPLNNGEFVFSIGVGDNGELLNRIHDILPITIVNNTSKSDQRGYLLVENESFLLSGE